jgi:serine/threonine protein kinase
MIGQTVSHYRILGKLGEGGMGIVYLAEDVLLERRVAVKTLNVELGKQHYRQRFLREARAVSALHHPNIAVVHDYGETSEGQPFIVMELVTGQTLNDLLHKDTLTLARVIEILEDVTEAISEAHRCGIIHRDIKPSNIAIDERNDVKVLDFGLAKNINANASGSNKEKPRALVDTQTREGIVIGTPYYLSPEQALSSHVDARSDIFSLGSLLYECVTGRPPFSGASAVEICAQIIRDNPRPPSELNPRVPPELDRIILKALAKKKEERYQTANELLADLRLVRLTLQDEACVARLNHVPASHVSWFRSLSALSISLQKPGFLVGAFLTALAIGLVVWAAIAWQHNIAQPSPPSANAIYWYKQGVNALHEGTYQKAVSALQKCLSVDNRFPLAHARLAEALIELDDIDKAKNEQLSLSTALLDGSAMPALDALRLQAINLMLTGDAERAIEKFQEIVRQAPDAEKPEAYIDLGRAYERIEEIEKAEASYVEATRLNPQLIAGFMRLGALLGRSQQSSEEALSAFSVAEEHYQILNDVEGQAEVFYQRGLLFMARRELEEAGNQLNQALAKAAAINSKYQQIRIRLQLSSVYAIEGQTVLAQQQASEVLQYAKANNLENYVPQGLLALGNALMVREAYDEAEKAFEQALAIATFYKGLRAQARALLSLASLNSHHREKTAQVIEYAEKALAFYQKGSYRRQIMQAHAILGHAYDQQGDYTRARNAFDQQLQLAEKINDRTQTASAREGLGIVFSHQEQYPSALSHFDESYKLYESLKMSVNTGHVHLNRANVYWQMGRYKDAQRDFDEVRRAEKPEEAYREVKALLHLSLARMALSRRRLHDAQTQCEDALKQAGEDLRDLVVETKYTLGVALALSGSTSSGKRLCDEALAMLNETSDPRLINGALLAQSIAMQESGESQNAMTTAMRAQAGFNQAGQQDSEWRALLIAALAARRAGGVPPFAPQQNASRAREVLTQLEQSWGQGIYSNYLRRPDVQYALNQLNVEFQDKAEIRRRN